MSKDANEKDKQTEHAKPRTGTVEARLTALEELVDNLVKQNCLRTEGR